jgi:murein DD-endopeptidase MepM/ murein hydrolase activator NlpD
MTASPTQSLIVKGLLSQLLFLSLATVSFAQDQHDTSRLPNAEPILRLPFPSGTVVFCQQGNLSPTGQSHSLKNVNCTHALDLTSLIDTEQIIVAAANGFVAKVNSAAKPGDEKAGGGFGNYVKIDHGNGYFTFYAHLKDVLVKEGDKVQSGTKIGIMGNTGKAGNAHLHFSLHRGDYSQAGTCATIPMHAVIAEDMKTADGFGLFSSLEFVGGGSIVSSKGHCYGSENSESSEFKIGQPDDVLRDKMESAYNVLAKKIGADDALQEILKNWRDGKSARNQLERLVRKNPAYYEAWYWIGFASIGELKEPVKAREAFNKILEARPFPRNPEWLRPWTTLRMAQVDEAQGEFKEARSRYKLASSFASQGKDFLKLANAGLKRCSGK